MAQLNPYYLADKSVLVRMRHNEVAARLAPLIEAGAIASCAIVDLEVLFSARNAEEHSAIARRRSIAYPSVPIEESTLRRAIEVQGLLAVSGRHRVPIPDLIIAATAEQAGLTVLHYDHDFDVIAEATKQPMEWVVPRGTLEP